MPEATSKQPRRGILVLVRSAAASESSQPPKASTTFVIVVRRRRSRRRRRRPKRWIFALAFVSAVLRAHDEVVVVLVVRVHEAGDLLLLLNARVGENRTSKQCLLVRLQSQFSTVTTFRGPRRHHYKGTKTTASLLLWRPLRPQPLLQCTKNLALPRSFDLWWLCKVKKSGSFGSRKRRRNDCEKWIRGNWIFLLPPCVFYLFSRIFVITKRLLGWRPFFAKH